MTPFLTATSFPAAHGFFTRAGGVSEGPYASLNASTSGADDPARVAENRARAARALGAQPARLLGATQVHGLTVAVVDQPWPAGAGPTADALVTRAPGVALAVVTADCAPVLFADPLAGIVGAAHAGWRGAVAGVLEATLTAMQTHGAGQVAAAIGPCIGAASYEVGGEVRAAAVAAFAPGADCFTPGRDAAHWQFDLAAYCAARLRAAGVVHVDTIVADTAAEPDRFFSHRRRVLAGGGPIGHQVSIVVAGGRG